MDLGRANLPWLIFWNYKQKYATNDIVEFFRDKPYQSRVANLPKWIPGAFRMPERTAGAMQALDDLYRIEWAQHLFQYFNVQSLDIVQMPRMPADLDAFERAMAFRGTQETLHLLTRRWQLTNTRYLLGTADMQPVLNQGLDGGQNRFQIAARFDITGKPGIGQPMRLEELTAVKSSNGTYAVFEFTGTLPRASLYQNWRAETNDTAVLVELAKPEFNPAQTVLVANPAVGADSGATNSPRAGTVEYEFYSPKHIVLNAKAPAGSILLLNDKFDPNWRVTVDGKIQPLLRCNYIMRGVQLPAGDHRVEFRFAPDVKPLYVSLVAIIGGAALIILLVVSEKRGVAGSRETMDAESKKATKQERVSTAT
jgi:hypothetical protein